MLGLFYDELPTGAPEGGDPLDLTMNFEGAGVLGEVQLEGLRVLPMYRPEHKLQAHSRWL